MSGNEKRILVVDDDARFVNDMKDYLAGRDDFKYAGGTGNAAEALRLVRDRLPHVILVDIMLGEDEGAAAAMEAMLLQMPLRGLAAMSGGALSMDFTETLLKYLNGNILTKALKLKKLAGSAAGPEK